MAQAARLPQAPSGQATTPSRPAQVRPRTAMAPVHLRVSQGETTIQPAPSPAQPAVTQAPAQPATVERATLATMLGVRLQEIQDTLQQPKATTGKPMSVAQRVELERQQAAIKRALAMTDTQEPVLVDTTLRQLLGPMATMLSASDVSGVDRLA